jgi:effector-binding domain-containing protein
MLLEAWQGSGVVGKDPDTSPTTSRVAELGRRVAGRPDTRAPRIGWEEMGMNAGQHPDAVVVEERTPQPVLSIRANVRVADLTQAQGESLRALWSLMQQRGVTPAGPPVVRYHTFGETQADLETGIPVAEAVAGEGRVAAGELPGGAAITTWHLGSHDGLADAYARLGSWLQANGRDADGAAWEVYWWIDPSVEPDPATWPAPAEWRTQLVQPIR